MKRENILSQKILELNEVITYQERGKTLLLEKLQSSPNKEVKNRIELKLRSLEQRNASTKQWGKWFEEQMTWIDDNMHYIKAGRDALAKRGPIDIQILKSTQKLSNLVAADKDLVHYILQKYVEVPNDVKVLLSELETRKFFKPPSIKSISNRLGFSNITQSILANKDDKNRINYAPNVSSQEAYDYYINYQNHIPQAGAYNELDEIMAIVRLNLLKPPSCRFATLYRQIFSLFMLSQYEEFDDKAFLWDGLCEKQNRKSGEDLVGLQAITYLLSRYKLIPWGVKSKMYVPRSNNFDFPTYLIPVLFICCNLAENEHVNNLTRQEALCGLMNIIEWATGNLLQDSLDKKSTNRAIIPNVIMKMKLFMTMKVNETDVSTTPHISDKPDIYTIEVLEKNEIKFKEANIGTRNFYNKIKPIIEKYGNLYEFDHIKGEDEKKRAIQLIAYQNTNSVKRIISVLNIISCTSIYNHGSILLAEEKSLAPQIKVVDSAIPISKYVYLNGAKYPMGVDENTTDITLAYKEIINYFNEELIPIFKKHYDYVDLESEFVGSLGTNSQGHKPTPDEAVALGMPKAIAKMSQARLIAFIYNQEMYMSLEELLKAIQRVPVVGTRSQIDRRFRIILMVDNGTQILSFGMLCFMNTVKPHFDIIAAGKQDGTIKDMRLQLTGTGGDFINSSADVTGMDTHTLQTAKDIIRLCTIKAYGEVEVSKYFCFSNLEVDVIDKNTAEILTKKEHINAMQSALILMGYHSNPSQNQGFDKIFNVLATLNGLGFGSGRFDTTTQHTLLLSAIVTQLVTKKAKEIGVDVAAMILGDDIYQRLRTSNSETVLPILQTFQKALSEINYFIDLNMSRYYAVFLQQDAFCGTYLPSPHRISLFTNERNDILDQSPYQRLVSLKSLSQQFGTRSWSEVNIDSVIGSAWISMSSSFVTDIPKIHNKFSNFILPLFDGYMLGMPYFMLNTQLCRTGLPIIITHNTKIEKSNQDEKGHQITYHTNGFHTALSGDGCFIDVTQTFGDITGITNTIHQLFNVPRIEEWGFFQAMYLAQTNPHQQITDQRKEEIGEAELETLVQKLELFQNAKKRQQSVFSEEILEQYNITLPDRLVYHKQPRERIINAVKEQPIKAKDYVQVKEYVTNFYDDASYSKWLNSADTFKRFLLGKFHLKETSSKIRPTWHSTFINFEIAPNCRNGTISKTLLGIMGHNLSERGSALISLGKYTNPYVKNKGIDIQELVNEGLKIYSKMENNKAHVDMAINNLVLAAGLSGKIGEDVKKAINELSMEIPSTPIHVIPSNTCHFYRSLHLGNLKDRFYVELYATKTKDRVNYNNAARILIRDCVFKNPLNFVNQKFLYEFVPSKQLKRLLTTTQY